MAASFVSRCLVRVVRAIPPLHRALDGWSQRRAQRSRTRRLRLAAQRQR